MQPLLSLLPPELVITFLSRWLDIKDVAKLDTAMTTQASQAAFLCLLKEMRSKSIQRDYTYNTFPALCWMSHREIFVEEIQLTTCDRYQPVEDRNYIKTEQLKDELRHSKQSTPAVT